MSPLDRVLNSISSVTHREPKKTRNGWLVCCPGHDDKNPSLSITQTDDGKVLVNCLAGCPIDDVLAAASLTATDLFPESPSSSIRQATERAPSSRSSKVRQDARPIEKFESPAAAIAVLEKKLGRRSAAWDYHDQQGNRVGVVVRWDCPAGKEIRPLALIDGGWAIAAMPESRPLFRLPSLGANPDVTIVLVEGEKAVDAAVSLGFVATTSAGGCKAAAQSDWAPLAGRSVVILPDHDKPGTDYANEVADILSRLDPPATVRIVNLIDDWPDLPLGGDIADWCDFHDAAEPAALKARIESLIQKAEPVQSVVRTVPQVRNQQNGGSLFLIENPWPEPLSDAAYWGLAGDIVRRIEPHSEADPAALLTSLLVAFGNLIGRTAYFEAEGSRHYLNLFTALVGNTSKGRKGSSWSQVSRLCNQFDEPWATTRILKGLSSGEGFIHAVRDPVEQQQPVRDRGRVIEYQNVIVDPGVDDKRLLVIEEEFASVLAVSAREGNILSPRLREAWDTGNLRTMTKNPVCATGAHVSIIGHITRDELRRLLTLTEQSNGFGNRFLWLCVRRSKCLPEGGRIHEVDFSDLVKRLEDARHFATALGAIERDEEAREFWHDIYPALSEGKPGLTGAMLGRAEAQVMRLACLYAVLDRSHLVCIQHLQAALAVWDFCEASTKHIFGSSLGNKEADALNAALRAAHPTGLTRTEISAAFSRNKESAQIDAALRVLVEHGLVRFEIERINNRDVERWYAVTVTN